MPFIINQTSLQVLRGSVTDQNVDAIVNAANTAMRGGGGIDGHIHRAAGPGLLEELHRVAPNGAETGTAVLTRGHRLKQPYIIHTPGPVWHGGRSGEPQLLANCYRSCMTLAHEEGLASIAFCSISTGIYGYPLEHAAPLAVKTVTEFLRGEPDTSLRKCIFAMYQADEFEAFSKAVEDV